jgi:hypothetical protein
MRKTVNVSRTLVGMVAAVVVVLQCCLQTYFVSLVDSHIDQHLTFPNPRNVEGYLRLIGETRRQSTTIETEIDSLHHVVVDSTTDMERNNNSNSSNFDDGDDAWIDTLEMGPFVGFGSINLVTHVLENGVDRGNLLKITGDHPDERWRNENLLDYSNADIDTHSILEPHISSIPRILKFQRRLANPFQSGRLTFHASMSEYDQKWLLRCDYISLILIQQSKPHPTLGDPTTILNHHQCLDIPSPPMARCFWRQLFETVQRSHELGIMNRDLNEKNILVSGGAVVLFDWNLSKRYTPDDHETNRVWNIRLYTPPTTTNNEKEDHYWIPPENRVKDNDNVFHNVHGYDVWCIGAMIRGMLECGQGGGAAGESEYLLLQNLYETMMVMDPVERPTLRQLLNDHNYFQPRSEGDREPESYVNCKLTW